MNKHYTIKIEGRVIPVKMILERRNGPRAALGAKEVILRIPNRSKAEKIKEYQKWAHDWLEDLYRKKPAIFDRYQIKKYESGTIIETTAKNYKLILRYLPRKTASATVEADYILIKWPVSHHANTAQMGRLIANVISKDQYPEIAQKVLQLNEQHFKEKINGIHLKYMTSRWGSCSTNGNINLSSRLLKAPEAILDSVIAHELAHTKEMNHSQKFWNWVAKADPNYKVHDQWLKKNGHSLFF